MTTIPNPNDVAFEAAKVASIVASFYNHLILANVPDEAAEAFTVAYIQGTFDAAIANTKSAAERQQLAGAAVDYSAIREFIAEAVKASRE